MAMPMFNEVPVGSLSTVRINKIRSRWGLIPVLFLFCIVSCSTKNNILKINFLNHFSLALHIHPTLEIAILSEKRVIPANIGISNRGLRVIHAHHPDGVVHAGSPVPHQFVLADFFAIWGKTLTRECVFEYCVDGDHVLEMLVKDERSDLFGTLPLREQDRIKIVYRKKQ